MTIKVPESKRYASDNPWITFRASDASTMKAHVVATFGLDAEEAVGLTLFDVVLNAQKIATKVGGVSTSMGGTIISTTPAGSSDRASVADAPAAEPEGPHPLLAEIEAQTSVPDLQNLWARNKAAFDADEALMDAYKAKGRSLS